jgi:predicted lipoprotein with Yx(FWY)xxD motif
MPRSAKQDPKSSNSRRPRGAAVLAIGAVAAVVFAALAGIAIAKTFNLGVEKHVKVGNKTEAVAVSGGKPVYWLGTETKSHLLCKGVCLTFWFPVDAPSRNAKLKEAAGIKGTLSTFHRGGAFQVMLTGHPLYTFKGDSGKGVATGNGIVFAPGAVWHVVTASVTSHATHTTTTTSSSSTSTSSTYTYSSYSYPGS